MQSNKCGTYAGYQAHWKLKEKSCSDCKQAAKIYRKTYYAKNRDLMIANAKAQNLANPEKYKTRLKAWRSANPEKSSASVKAWVKQHPERVREMARANDRKRRAIQKNNQHEKYSDQEVLDTYGTKCHLCLKPIDLKAPRSTHKKGWENGLHIDHVIPISKGGADMLSNVRPAHGICNIRKRNHTQEANKNGTNHRNR